MSAHSSDNPQQNLPHHGSSYAFHAGRSSLDDLLLASNTAGFDSMVCQTEIQTTEDKIAYAKKGYTIALTEQEFKEKFTVDPSCKWYTPSISLGSFYFNQQTLAACPFCVDLFLFDMGPDVSGTYRAIEERERAVANHDHWGSLLTLTDAMRLEYFKLLIAQKGSQVPDLYHLFIQNYRNSDYGFSRLDPDMLQSILAAKTETERSTTQEKLQALPNPFKIYRGGNTASTPYSKAYSWTLDINVANFFACRRGTGTGYIVEATVNKKDVIEALIDDADEQEIIVAPGNIHLSRKYSIKGVEAVKNILPQIASVYHKYMDKLDHLDFAIDSSQHGPPHEARVMLNCLTIAHLLDLPLSDYKVLATAAIFHDTQRVDDEVDICHGKASRDYYHNHEKHPDPLVEFLCEYHCRPDEEGYAEINRNRILSKSRSRSTLLYQIFKDADALDRVRFGLRNLDLNQLRLPISKELTLLARLYLEHVDISNRTGGVERISPLAEESLDTKIQKAASKADVCSSSIPSSTKTNTLGL